MEGDLVAVEDRMKSDLNSSGQAHLGLMLSRCVASLNNGAGSLVSLVAEADQMLA